MSNINPVSNLRNHNEVLKNCVNVDPVFLPKNGHKRYVILDIKDYEKQQATI
jgi:PHD/YefM family antitoxin component YafN of YafNO toxin-antitoxin module